MNIILYMTTQEVELLKSTKYLSRMEDLFCIPQVGNHSYYLKVNMVIL